MNLTKILSIICCLSLAFSSHAQTLEVDHAVDLFSSSGLIVGTSPFSYRIPALATTNTGRLIALCDARYGTTIDLPNDIDLVIRKSDDNGDTWTPRETIINSGFIGSGDPQILIDKTTNDIFVFYAYQVAWTSPVQEIRYIKSSDNGDTWSNPTNILPSVFDTNDINMWAGPGNGIQLRNGRLIAPYSLNSQGIQDSIQSCFIYSDDHGVTWNRSVSSSGTGLEEPTMVELNNGDLMLNARSRRGFARRGISYTGQDGATWTSTYDHPDLLDPIVQGSMIRYTSILDGYAKDRLLFSNPRSESERENLTIHISYDEGATWQVLKTLDPNGSAYSSMTILDNGDIGILYEKGYGPHGILGIIYPNHVSFARFTLDALTDGADSLVICSEPVSPSISEITSTSSLVSWTTSAGTYDIEYKQSTESQWTILTDVTSPYTLSGLESNTEYDIRIRWNCSAVSMLHSNSSIFQTDVETNLFENTIQNKVQILPNPSGGNINIQFEEILKFETQLNVIDLLGRVLFSKQILNQHTELDLTNLSEGIYFLTLSNESGRHLEKIHIKKE